MVFCKNKCLVATGLILSNIYFNIRTNKEQVSKELTSLLNEEQKKKYDQIRKNRMRIAIHSWEIGVLVALVLYFFSIRKLNLPVLSTLCSVYTIMYFASYLFYMLKDKGEYMISHLDNKEQIDAWLKVYRTMQKNHNMGLALGITASILIYVF